MLIKTLQLKDFRNYHNITIDFNDHINIFYGKNAQGKTNILEAIYVSCVNKSHRGSKDREMIRFGCEEAHIKLVLEKRNVGHRIDFHLKKNAPKGIALDGIPLKKVSELLGIVNVIFFSPEDLYIIKNGPAFRRKFIDLELCQLDKIYIDNLVKYNRILLQKSKLLKEISQKPQLEKTLDSWNQQMVYYGNNIIERRKTFIEDMNGILENIHKKITGGKESVKIIYESNIVNDFSSELQKITDKEIKYKTCLCGPHRDDIMFVLNNQVDLRKFGSQGQQRTVALSLKLSEIEMIRKTVNDMPLLLLDDVLSELDEDRQSYLLDNIKNIQTMITCTGLDDFVKNRFHLDNIFYVEDGCVTKKN